MAGKAGAIRAGRAFVELFADDSRLQQGLKRAQARLRSFGATLAKIGAAATTAFLGAAKVFADSGDQLDKLSARTGASVEFLSRLGIAADRSGTSLEKAGKTILRMQRRLGKVAGSGGEAEKGLKDLGLSFRELRDLNPEERFLRIVDAMNAMEDQSKAAGAAQRIFGAEVDAILPLIRAGREGIQRMGDQAEQFGQTLTREDATAAAKLTDRLADLRDSLGGLVKQIGAAVAPALTDLAKRMTKTVGRAVEWVKNNRAAVVTTAVLAAKTAALGGALLAFSVVVGTLSKILWGLRAAYAAAAAAKAFLLSLTGKGLVLVAAAAAATAAGVVALNKAVDSAVQGNAQAAAAIDETKQASDRAADAARNAAGAYNRAAGAARGYAGATRAATEELKEFAAHRLTNAEKLRGDLSILTATMVRLKQQFPGLSRIIDEAFRSRRLELIDETTGVVSKIREVREEIAKLSGAATDTEIMLKKMAEAGAPPKLLDRLRELIKLRNDLQNDLQKREKKQEQEVRKLEGLRSEAEQLEKGLRTPLEKFRDEAQRLSKLRNTIDPETGEALISRETFRRGMLRNAQRARDALKRRAEELSQSAPVLQGTDVRSREGFRRIQQATGALRSGDSPEVKQLKTQIQKFNTMIGKLKDIEKNTGKKFIKK